MKRTGVRFLFSVLCSFAILAEPVLSAPSASTTEISRADAARRVDPFASTKNDPDCSWFHAGHAADSVQAEKELTRDSSRFKEGSVQDTRHSKHTGDSREDGVPSSRQRGPAVDLSSHDTLSDSDPISAGTVRQAKRNTGDYRNPVSSSVRSTSDDVAGRRSIGSSRRWSSDPKDDIGVAEDRYPPRNPYWYQRQYSNQRYRPNDRRDPYRNYLRYPVFPGR